MKYLPFIIIPIIFFNMFACMDTDDTIERQQTAILNYIQGQGWGDIYDSLSSDVYRVLEGDRLRPYASIGDSVEFRYIGRIFVSAPTTIFYTNIPSVRDSLRSIATNFNPEYWDINPAKIKLGTTDILEGLTLGMEGAGEGDTAYIFLTADSGYGDHELGQVPRNSALAFEIRIERIY